MLTLTMALMTMAAQGLPTPNPGQLPARCRPGDGLASQPGPREGRAQKLNELPPADQYYALYRRGPDGCPDPIVLRKGIGANPDRQLDITPVPPRARKVR